MSTSIEFAPLATSDPLDNTDYDQPITTSAIPNASSTAQTATRPRNHNSLSATMERITDATIKGLGPVLLTIAFLLLSIVIFCFFTVVLPFHYSWQEGQGIFGNWAYILNLVWSCYLVWGIAANYYYAVRTPPGGVLDGVASSGDAMFQDVLLEMETYTQVAPTCKRCHLPKPERTHHCSVCKRCVLKYDHHCPWIHNCVGHFNHRFFIMFLTYLSISCVYYVFMGVGPFLLAADMESEALTAQTTLEQYNNAYIKQICKKRGETFTNMYDFGIIGNFQDLFNIGPRGHYPWYTALLPLRIPPIGNGKRFERSGRGYILDFGEDDEDMV
ncbi:hypothetical protein EDD11_003285 [Mortierella claussenii]|nr:hypothetical protein EDD11_003285 [Mortierella claussenii]